MDLSSSIALAFLLDLILGDPRKLPHPVRGLGRLAEYFEKVFRGKFKNQKLAGVVMVITMIVFTYGATRGFLEALRSLNAHLHFWAETILIYTSLSVRGLYDESRPVETLLRKGDLQGARDHLRWIVGRDTHDMDQQGVIRATVETVAENTVDGVIAPLFYAFIGGAPLALAYKCINTLDSMFGHKNQTYIQFGWASARLDDCAGWIPARLGGPIMIAAAFLAGPNGRSAWATMIRDGQKHLSPNAGIPEAVMAGALGIQLGGPQRYQGRLAEKPFLGTAFREVDVDDIARSHHMLFAASFLALIFFMLTRNSILALN